MEIRTLRYFLAVAREENMTRAAEQLHVTQPTLSKALKSLEDELGKKLFTRHSFSIRLTEEGVLLRNRAEDLVSMADRIEKEFVSLLPGKSTRSNNPIPDFTITLPAATRNRSRKSLIRGFWTLQCLQRSPTLQSMNHSSSRNRIPGAS